MATSTWSLAIFALACGCSHFVEGAKIPVRRSPSKTEDHISPKQQNVDEQEDEIYTGAKDDMICFVWGDARPAGYKFGTTKMTGKLFATLEEATEQVHKAVKRNSDVAILFHGNQELKRYISPRMTNVVRWRHVFDWCNKNFHTESAEKFRPATFLLSPPAPPVRKDKTVVHATSALKQQQKLQHQQKMAHKHQLQVNDEDEAPPTAYLDEVETMHCVVSADSRAKGKTTLSATLFENLTDAESHFKVSKATASTSFVVQYKGKYEWKHHVSGKLNKVNWLSLFDWCKQLDATRKKMPKGSPFAKDVFGKASQREIASLIEPHKRVPESFMEKGLSMAETAETVGTWRTAEFTSAMNFDEVEDWLQHGMTRQVLSYQRFPGWTCNLEESSDVRLAGVDLTPASCKAFCSKDLQCSCLQYNRSNGACYTSRLAHCNEKHCKRSKATSIYLQKAQWAADTSNVVKFAGKACAVKVDDIMTGRGGEVLGTEKNVPHVNACKSVCAAATGCKCFMFGARDGSCTTMSECEIEKCENSKHKDMYLHTAVHNSYSEHAGHPW